MFSRRLQVASSSSRRTYAISVSPGKHLPGKTYPRVFHDKKLFQYNWYTKILNTTRQGSPLIFVHRDAFSANRLKRLRQDIQTASRKVKSSSSSSSGGGVEEVPTLTVVRTGIFGAALRDFPHVNLTEVDEMLKGLGGGYAVLSLPVLDPPLLTAILRAMDRSVPPRPPKTPEELAAELALKTGDPAQPGRRVKRQRAVLTPDLKVMGALVEGKVLLPGKMKEVSELPRLDTLRAQIVGLLSAPASQLAGVLSQAGGGQLARTLEGLKKTLEEEQQQQQQQ